MATRLTHSSSALLRLLQLSRYQLWIFVEGVLDRAAYGLICYNSRLIRIDYQISLAQEIHSSHGAGKRALVAYYQYLRRRNGLASEFKGKRTVVLFFLDKDVDDVLRIKARSPHVVYTEFYSVENILFRFGDLCKAVVAAANLDFVSVQGQIGSDPIRWTSNAAGWWKDWVSFCLFVRIAQLNAPNYGMGKSDFHDAVYAASNQNRKNALIRQTLRKSGLTKSNFIKLYKKAEKYVEKVYTNNKWDQVFNGKWYGPFIVHDVHKAAAGRSYNSNGLVDRILSCLLSTLDTRGQWTNPFTLGIEWAMKLLGS